MKNRFNGFRSKFGLKAVERLRGLHQVWSITGLNERPNCTSAEQMNRVFKAQFITLSKVNWFEAWVPVEFQCSTHQERH